jgi:hypothetical protein
MNQALSTTAALPRTAPPHQIDEEARDAALARLGDLFSRGEVSHACFSGALEQLFAAQGHDDLARAMQELPPVVRLTPCARRLATPLVVQTADGEVALGAGWQLAAATTIRSGVGAARVDLTTASWDTLHVSLHVETWGAVEVLVPEGVAVQMAGGAGRVHLESLSTPVPGGPVLRISISGPAGVIRIRHAGARRHRFTRWRRWGATPGSTGG